MSYVLLALFLLLVGTALLVFAVFAIAFRLLRPTRMGDGKALAVLKRLAPDDLGLSFEPMNFNIRDQAGMPLRIAGWWMPAAVPSEKTVILVHGYADAKVGAIAWAPLWHGLGYQVLAIDLRAHGETDGQASARNCTAGYFEREDLVQVIDALRGERPGAGHSVTLFGVSLGAAVVCATAAGRDDIAAVVVDSPFDNYPSAVARWADLAAVPLPRLSGMVCRAAAWISGADYSAVAPITTIPKIAAPVLVMLGEDDVFLTPVMRQNLANAVALRQERTHREIVIFPASGHNLAFSVDPARYRMRLHHFLNQSPQSY